MRNFHRFSHLAENECIEYDRICPVPCISFGIHELRVSRIVKRLQHIVSTPAGRADAGATDGCKVWLPGRGDCRQHVVLCRADNASILANHLSTCGRTATAPAVGTATCTKAIRSSDTGTAGSHWTGTTLRWSRFGGNRAQQCSTCRREGLCHHADRTSECLSDLCQPADGTP